MAPPVLEFNGHISEKGHFPQGILIFLKERPSHYYEPIFVLLIFNIKIINNNKFCSCIIKIGKIELLIIRRHDDTV